MASSSSATSRMGTSSFSRGQPSRLGRIEHHGRQGQSAPLQDVQDAPRGLPAHNADFDGDEMTLHIPQSKEAQTEARLLMQVQDQILSPALWSTDHRRYKGLHQWSLPSHPQGDASHGEGGWEASRARQLRGRDSRSHDEKPVKQWSGKQVFSLFLPKDFSFVSRANVCRHCPTCDKEACQYDSYVLIQGGELLNGVIDKNSIGAERAEDDLPPHHQGLRHRHRTRLPQQHHAPHQRLPHHTRLQLQLRRAKHRREGAQHHQLRHEEGWRRASRTS